MNRANFSSCRRYRYTLWRTWVNDAVIAKNYVNFICLNPSTADDVQDDNTIRKCIKFAKSWGYGGMCVTNLFAWRATDPKEMLKQSEPIGPDNDYYLWNIAANSGLTIAAWSQHGKHMNRSKQVREAIGRPLHILRMGKAEPWHPLYLPDSTQPVLWEGDK